MNITSIVKCFSASLPFFSLLMGMTLASTNTFAEVNAQRIPGPNGELATGSINNVGMSRSGRYMMLPNWFGSDDFDFYIRDIKTQTTTPVASPVYSGTWSFYAISPNGRYLAFTAKATKTSESVARVVDRVTQDEHILADYVYGNNFGLSNTGRVLYIRESGASDQQLVMLEMDGSGEQVIVDTASSQWSGISLGTLDERNPLSAQGDVALYEVSEGSVDRYFIYSEAEGSSSLFKPTRNAGIPTNPTTASLSADGDFVTFMDSPTNGRLYRVNLEENPDFAQGYNINSAHFVDPNGGLSISTGGRYISFYGVLQPGHPEYLEAEAIGNPGYNRIFRYDTLEDSVVTVTQGYDGGPITRDASGGTPMVNRTSIISHDGSMVAIATNSYNVTSTPPSEGGEENYHIQIEGGFERNYQFVDMPNTGNNWQMFSPMTLVDDNQWEGYLTFEASSGNAFKFDAGGAWENGQFVATPNWDINFGASGNPGQSVQDGGEILVSQGAGTYKVTFNDLTLEYSVTKEVPDVDWQRTVVFIYGQTVSGQDMFVRGGIDHAYAQNQLGLDCTASNYLCAMPIQYRNTLNPYTANWKVGDNFLDWYGREANQTLGNANGLAEGTVMDWTTNNASNPNTVEEDGVGYTPLNTWGDHYWMLDVDLDCSKTVGGWFELKSFISNGPGWEADVNQADTPYSSGNHFARCGYINRFQRGDSSAEIIPFE